MSSEEYSKRLAKENSVKRLLSNASDEQLEKVKKLLTND